MKERAYYNDIIHGLEKVLYYERGKGSCFRVTLVGTEFIRTKEIEGDTVAEIIDKCLKALIDAEILQALTFTEDEKGLLFSFKMKGCTHLPIEARLKEDGVPPYVCAPINMILYKITEILNLAVEIVDIHVDENHGECRVRVVVFAKD